MGGRRETRPSIADGTPLKLSAGTLPVPTLGELIRPARCSSPLRVIMTAPASPEGGSPVMAMPSSYRGTITESRRDPPGEAASLHRSEYRTATRRIFSGKWSRSAYLSPTEYLYTKGSSSHDRPGTVAAAAIPCNWQGGA